MTSLRLVDPLGGRPLSGADLPLSIGGAGCAVVVPGAEPGTVLASVGSSDGRLFIEPGPGAELRLDGRRLEASGWLAPGSVADLGRAMVRLERHEDGDGGPIMDARFGASGGSGDDLYDRAVAVVLRDGKASTSYIQRALQLGYNRAANLIERMERDGIVSPPNHAGKREILAGSDAA